MCGVSTDNRFPIKCGQMVFLNTKLHIPLLRNIICSSSTNHFIIGTIHKHQNFKKLTQQATTKQSQQNSYKTINHTKLKETSHTTHNLNLALPTFETSSRRNTHIKILSPPMRLTLHKRQTITKTMRKWIQENFTFTPSFQQLKEKTLAASIKMEQCQCCLGCFQW